MKKILYFFPFFIIFQSASCIEIDRVSLVKPDLSENIVITARLLDSGAYYQVVVTKTFPTSESKLNQNWNEAYSISNATVYIIDPTNKRYDFTYKKLPTYSAYLCPLFSMTDGTYKLIVEVNGSIYESICTSVPTPKLEKVELTPVPNQAGRFYIYSSFIDDKDIDNYYYIIIKYFPYMSEEYYPNRGITLPYLSKEFFPNFYRALLTDQDKLNGYDGLRYVDQQIDGYSITPGEVVAGEKGYKVNIKDSITTELVSLHAIEGKNVLLSRSNLSAMTTYFRTNIKNTTTPNKPPIGYFTINRYAVKSVVRTK